MIGGPSVIQHHEVPPKITPNKIIDRVKKIQTNLHIRYESNYLDGFIVISNMEKLLVSNMFYLLRSPNQNRVAMEEVVDIIYDMFLNDPGLDFLHSFTNNPLMIPDIYCQFSNVTANDLIIPDIY